MKNKLIFKITYCSIMAAMAGVIAMFPIPVFTIELTLYAIPLIFVGIVYGPGYGLLTGLLAGIIEQIRYGISLQTIFWLLAPIAWGGISGLGYFIINKNSNNKVIKMTFYATVIIISAIIANLFNSFALAYLGYSSTTVSDLGTFLAYAIPRLISIPIHVIIYIPVCYLVCEKFKKITLING